MKEKIKNRDHAYHGSEWSEHEDFLVGNKKGLEKLQLAINEALEKGESSIDSGEFIGVRCLESEFFENHTNQVGKLSKITDWFVVTATVFIFVVGIKTVFSLIGSSC